DDAVHDFRVSLRRFGEALWLFRRLFPKRERKQVREELRVVMKLAGRVRDCDIGVQAFQDASVSVAPALGLFLKSERATGEAALQAALAVGVRTEAVWRWKAALQLESLSEAPAAPEPVTGSEQSAEPGNVEPEDPQTTQVEEAEEEE